MFDLSRPLPFGLSRRNWPYWLLGLIVVLGLVLVVDAGLSRYATAWPEPYHGFFSTITDVGLADWSLVPALKLLLFFLALTVMFRHEPGLRQALLEWVQLSAFVFVGIGLPSLAANLFKRAIGRGRPELFGSVGDLHFQNFVNDYTYQSFPSGHATTIFAIAMVTGFLVPRAFPAMLVLAVIVALSRVAVGAHYPTDVLGGVVCGVLCAYLVRNAFAARHWLFERSPQGLIVRRGLPATRRALAD